MRTLLVLASLLLLLATRANGIRLERQLNEAIKSKKEMGDSKAGQPSNTAHSMNKHCTSDGHCSGKAQKPLAHAESGAAKQQSSKRNDDTTVDEVTTSQSRHDEVVRSHGGGQAEVAVVRGASPRVPWQPQTTHPDILDIAGMDYSPATRKPPIHN